MEPLIETIRQLGKSAMQEGRDTLYSLRDEQICACSGQGLIELLQPQIDVFQEQSGIMPLIDIHDPVPCIPTSIGHQLRRMVGEALMNIHRHALAHNVQLNLWNNGRELRIEIRDDGVGFHPGRVNYQTSFGLSGMRERSRLIDAKLSVDSTPGKGTKVTIRWPLMQAEPCTTCHAAADLRKRAE
jgi:signal transduction histidine kinase